MGEIVLGIVVSENKHTRDIESVADELESFGISFADNARLNESTDSR